MATKLTKPVARELMRTTATKRGRLSAQFEHGRPILVTLNPEETITFRVKGTRTKYTVHLMNVFTLAKVVELESIFRSKMDTYKLRKSAGLRAKKPKRPVMMETSLIRKAI